MRYQSMKEVAEAAIAVQTAVNFSGVAHALGDICTYLRVTENLDSTECARHPAVILVLDKLNDLAGRPEYVEFSRAYEACRHLAGRE